MFCSTILLKYFMFAANYHRFRDYTVLLHYIVLHGIVLRRFASSYCIALHCIVYFGHGVMDATFSQHTTQRKWYGYLVLADLASEEDSIDGNEQRQYSQPGKGRQANLPPQEHHADDDTQRHVPHGVVVDEHLLDLLGVDRHQVDQLADAAAVSGAAGETESLRQDGGWKGRHVLLTFC